MQNYFKEHKFEPLEVQPTQRNTWKENWGDQENLYYYVKIQKLCRSRHFWDASLMVWCISTWCINIMDALIKALCTFCLPAHWKAPGLCLLVPPIWSRSGREFGSTDSPSEKSFSPNTSGRFMDGSRNQRWVSQNSCGDLHHHSGNLALVPAGIPSAVHHCPHLPCYLLKTG